MRLIRAFVLALSLLMLSTSYAAADEGSGADTVPFDPGWPSADEAPPAPTPWELTE
jgi:hypothetical protein